MGSVILGLFDYRAKSVSSVHIFLVVTHLLSPWSSEKQTLFMFV